MNQLENTGKRLYFEFSDLWNSEIISNALFNNLFILGASKNPCRSPYSIRVRGFENWDNRPKEPVTDEISTLESVYNGTGGYY